MDKAQTVIPVYRTQFCYQGMIKTAGKKSYMFGRTKWHQIPFCPIVWKDRLDLYRGMTGMGELGGKEYYSLSMHFLSFCPPCWDVNFLKSQLFWLYLVQVAGSDPSAFPSATMGTAGVGGDPSGGRGGWCISSMKKLPDSNVALCRAGHLRLCW